MESLIYKFNSFNYITLIIIFNSNLTYWLSYCLDIKKALNTRLYDGLICVYYLFILWHLLSDTKLAENIPEHLFIVYFASDGTQGANGGTEVKRQ